MMSYAQYLFLCLLKESNARLRAMPYDEQYEHGMLMWHHYRLSGFDDPSKGLYECINEYIKETNYDKATVDSTAG